MKKLILISSLVFITLFSCKKDIMIVSETKNETIKSDTNIIKKDTIQPRIAIGCPKP